MKKLLCVFCACLIVAIVAPPAVAANFPSKPITVLCIFGPGGAADLGLRVITEHAGKRGYTMNVVNKSSGGGVVATLDTMKARPDGYTVLFTATPIITLPLLRNVGFTLDDFTPVANMSDMSLTFCSLTSSGIKTFKEWLGKALAEPGKFSYGSPSSVSTQRLMMNTLIKDHFPDANIPHVPYTSGHEVNTALLGGHIQAAFGVPGTNRSYLQSGQFTLLAVSSAKRLAEYPDVPTFAEMYGEKFIWAPFHGFFVSKKTPKPIVDTLAKIIKDAMEDPEVLEKFKKIGLTADYRGPEEYAGSIEIMRRNMTEAFKGLNM